MIQNVQHHFEYFQCMHRACWHHMYVCVSHEAETNHTPLEIFLLLFIVIF